MRNILIEPQKRNKRTCQAVTYRHLLTFFLIFSFLNIGFAQKKKVVATASMIGDMAEVLSGGLLDVETIVPIGGDPHTYEPTPSDASLANSADLILKNGLTFEGWLNELIANSGTKAVTVLVTDGIQPIESAIYKNATDPHAWMDLTLGKKYAENIVKAFIELDPENKEAYNFNLEVYSQQIDELDKYILEQVKTIPESQRILITSHDAFQYFGRRYGLKLESVMGTSTDAEVQTSDVAHLRKVIKETKVPAVFIESTINPKLLQQIASDSGVKIGGKLFADSIGDKDSKAPTYLDMLRYNTDVIVAALKGNIPTDLKENEPAGTNWLYFGLLGLALILGSVFLFNKMQ